MESSKAKFSLVRLPVDDDPVINSIESIFEKMSKCTDEEDEIYMALILEGLINHIAEYYSMEYDQVYQCLGKLHEADFWWTCGE